MSNMCITVTPVRPKYAFQQHPGAPPQRLQQRAVAPSCDINHIMQCFCMRMGFIRANIVIHSSCELLPQFSSSASSEL